MHGGPTTTSTRHADLTERQSLRQPRAALPILIIGGALALGLALIARQALKGVDTIPPYHAPQYWLDYRDGFVRRGLPGEVVALLGGGNPSLALVETLAIALSLGAVAAIAALAWRASWDAPRRLHQTATLAVIAVSPLTVTLVARDLGRYDDIGIIAMFGLVALPWRARPWLAAAAGGVLVAVAVASEEFLLAYLAPIVLIQILRQLPDGTRRAAGLAALSLAPGALLAAASLIVDPTRALITDTLNRAAGHGVPTGGHNAVSVLGWSLGQELGHVGDFSLPSIVLTVAMWAAFFLAAALLLHRLSPSHTARHFAALAGYYAAVALALGAIGVDYRRWWGLALIGMLACCALPGSRRTERTSATTRAIPTAVLIAVALVSLMAALAPIYPTWGAISGS